MASAATASAAASTAATSSTSGSSWPPELKGFVARALAAASPVNKQAVNEEMRKVIFQAHREGSMASRDWASMDPFVVLESLRNQRLRAAAPPPPPPPPSAMYGLPTSFGSRLGPAVHIQNQPSPGGIVANGGATKRKKGAAPPVSGANTSPIQVKGNKKMKQSSITTTGFPSGYTFASTEEDEARAKRAARFQREQEIEAAKANAGPMFVPHAVSSRNGHHVGGVAGGALDVTDDVAGDGTVKLSQMRGGRAANLGSGGWLGSRLGIDEPEPDANVINWDRYTIVGTSTRLEKRYLRLTSEPNPADIRPLPVLQQTLQLLKRKWRENQDYAYVCDQFKSLRQDLTVQRIKNEFTVTVYEIHARMALEAKDLGEYNQCQSMLRQLYEHNIAGHPDEFMAYRILYMLHTRNTGELGRIISHLTVEEKRQGPVQHALSVASAIATGNYHRFFKLFIDAPNMGGYIMDHFVERERIIALTKMSKAYITLPLTYLTSELAFENVQHTAKFLEDHEAAQWHQPANTAFPDLKTAHAINSRNHRRQPAPRAIPLEDRVWDCKAAHAACERGIQRYRTVDLKGQI